jgi:hypothetical protein
VNLLSVRTGEGELGRDSFASRPDTSLAGGDDDRFSHEFSF